MNKICSYLDIVRADEFERNVDAGFIVEECATYDSALENFWVICRNDNIDAIKEWIADNCRKVGNHANRSIDRGKGTFALSLVKTALRLSSYTEEFVNACGSLQGFLDKWGDKDTVFPEGNIADDVQHDKDIVFKELEQQNASAEEYSDEDETEDYLGLNFTVTEPEDITDSQEDESENELEDEKFMGVFETDSKRSETYSVENTLENKFSEDEYTDAKEEAVSEENLFAVTTKMPEDADGIEVPFLSNVDGNTVIHYKDLMNVAAFIRKAAEELEIDDVSDTELLTQEDKAETLKYLDEFSPSLIKRFFLSYVESAESDVDYVRVTKLLDKFCDFVENGKMNRVEVGYE